MALAINLVGLLLTVLGVICLLSIVYLVHCIDILIYSLDFGSILNDLWRGGEAKLLSSMAKWQITGAHQFPFLAVAVDRKSVV